jgi:hypothetical protein
VASWNELGGFDEYQYVRHVPHVSDSHLDPDCAAGRRLQGAQVAQSGPVSVATDASSYAPGDPVTVTVLNASHAYRAAGWQRLPGQPMALCVNIL